MLQSIRTDWVEGINSLMLKKCRLYTPSNQRWVSVTAEGIGNTLRQKIWVAERNLTHCEEYNFSESELKKNSLQEFSEWYYNWWLKDLKHRLGDAGYEYYLSLPLNNV